MPRIRVGAMAHSVIGVDIANGTDAALNLGMDGTSRPPKRRQPMETKLAVYDALNGTQIALFTFGMGHEWVIRIAAQVAK